MSAAVDASTPDDEQVVANRYRIEQRLAKGGMGIVYRAFDPVHGRTVALKRLHTGDARSRQRRMFEREYATLVGLQHPRIIEVHDYGVDEIGAYYTMELLDGRDLRELSPLPASLACKYLRDVASSLALLHARRLLHRDLSPRNVRITSDGRAKLIDFGGLASFGKHTTVVGTPPCVPPEALTGAALDQRADLYSLGALAYFLLTGRHAFEIRALPELVAALRRTPEPPSHVAREPKEPIPAELDELVMALLSRDPMARPASAAEVIERLSAIAGLPAEREPRSATSYLLGGRTMGRARERAKLRGCRKRALHGRGGAVLIEAVTGMGAARMLEDLALEAQLTGAITAFIDARSARGSFGVAQALLREIARNHPNAAQLALGEDRALVAPLLVANPVEGSRRHSAHSAHGAQGDPREQRLREQRALVAFVERLCEQAPLVLCVRGLEQADESSLALLWALSQSAATRRLLIVGARDPMQTPAAPALLKSFAQGATRVDLQGLQRHEVRALVETSFGPVPGTERMSEWLQRVSGGNPLGCLELLRHLVDTQRIRFADGVWAMPMELSPSELPSALEQVIEARIDQLPQPARALANALCVERGIAPHARCHAIAKLERIGDPAAALEALVDAQVVVESPRGYRFAHETMRIALAERLPAAERRRLHRALGSLLSDLSGGDPEILLDAGWHLLHGGDESRGADLLARAGREVAWDANAMPLAIPALRAALEVFRAQRRSPHDLALLIGTLAMAGYYSDRRVMEQFGDEAIDRLTEVTGVRRARALKPKLGAWLAIVVSLAIAGFGFVRHFGRHGLSRFREALTMLITGASMMTGLSAMTLDPKRAQKYIDVLEPLLPLGRAVSVSRDLSIGLSQVPTDYHADALDRLRHVVEECRNPMFGMPSGSVRMALSGALYGLGNTEALCEDPRALDRAAELEAMGSPLFEMFANQIRTLHHSLRGEAELARAYRSRVEAHALLAGSSWQAEVWGPSSQILACELVRDLEEAKRVMEELDRLAAEIPSLRKHAVLARSSYYKMRGDCTASVKLRTDALALSPRSFTGWPTMMAGHVLDCARTNQLERALHDGRAALALYTPRDQIATPFLTPLYVELALAEAEAGELATARGRIESALAAMADRGGPATRGTLHEAAARIALVAGDRDLAQQHLREVEHCFRPTRNPVLIGRCERLRRAVGRRKPPSDTDAVRDTLDLGPPVGGQTPIESVAPMRSVPPPPPPRALAIDEATPPEDRTSGTHERTHEREREPTRTGNTVPPPSRGRA